MMKHTLIAVTLLIAPIDAWASDGTFWGTTLGATFGGIVGSTIGKGDGNLAATGAGVLLGGVIGNSIGRSIDQNEGSVRRSTPYHNYGYYRPSFGSYQPTYVAPPAIRQQTIYIEEPQIIEFHQAPHASQITGSYVGPPSGSAYPQQQHENQYCREFTQTIKIDGQRHESYGTACLRPDGSWQVVQ